MLPSGTKRNSRLFVHGWPGFGGWRATVAGALVAGVLAAGAGVGGVLRFATNIALIASSALSPAMPAINGPRARGLTMRLRDCAAGVVAIVRGAAGIAIFCVVDLAGASGGAEERAGD